MDVVRTPDERFADLPDWPFEPRCVELAEGLRVHVVDVLDLSRVTFFGQGWCGPTRRPRGTRWPGSSGPSCVPSATRTR